jgi:FkbM family methyltransferase
MADLECDRMTEANEVLRLREMVTDLERDKDTSANEMARLSAIISELQLAQVRHEVPRLGGVAEMPNACDLQDPVGLRRVVEAQASDLVRLRRSLLSSRTVAAQRLLAFHVDGKVFEWTRSAVLEEIKRTQDAISDVIENSRWRRIGLRLGVAKRTAWETGHWQTDLVSAGSTPSAGGRTREPSIAELRVEFQRLYGLLDDLRRSRWRKLGHRLRLAKRLAWEAEARHDPFSIERSPTEQAESSYGEDARGGTSRSSYIGSIEYTTERFLEECRGFATDVILDIGANIGQFAQCLRAGGYHGHIISFEPLSDAHATLVAAAAADPLWDVAERCAVGASDGWAEINIASNSYSSSLLPMLDLHREAAPQSVYRGTEPCRVVALDTYIERTFSDPTTLIGLKIDTQGFEAQVLEGLRRHQDRVKVVVCEMSLAPLYANSPNMSELCRLLAEIGYRCVALGPEFDDPRTGELLQANGVFVKRG